MKIKKSSIIRIILFFSGFLIFSENLSAQTEGELLIPNIFTPNNDGHNDLFKFSGKPLSSLSCLIFNRYGLKLYEWNTVQGGWDGRTAGGEMVPEGVYFFILEYKDQSGGTEKKSGSLLLIR